jgi:hypothetical protein
MAVITTFTREISEHSTPAIEGVLRQAIAGGYGTGDRYRPAGRNRCKRNPPRRSPKNGVAGLTGDQRRRLRCIGWRYEGMLVGALITEHERQSASSRCGS